MRAITRLTVAPRCCDYNRRFGFCPIPSRYGRSLEISIFIGIARHYLTDLRPMMCAVCTDLRAVICAVNPLAAIHTMRRDEHLNAIDLRAVSMRPVPSHPAARQARQRAGPLFREPALLLSGRNPQAAARQVMRSGGFRRAAPETVTQGRPIPKPGRAARRRARQSACGAAAARGLGSWYSQPSSKRTSSGGSSSSSGCVR